MNSRETVGIDPERAPITQALAMQFQSMDADIAAAELHQRDRIAIDRMYAFLSDVILAVHQLETGTVPEHVNFPEDQSEE